MRKLLWTLPVLALGLVALTPNDVQGFGRKKADCAPADCAPPPCVVGYVDKVVTTYQAQTVEEEVEVTVYKPVYTEKTENYKYYECQRVVTPTKQTVKWWEQVVTEEAVTYKVCKQVVTPTKVKVNRWVCTPTKETVEVNSYKTVTTPTKVNVKYCEWVTTEEEATWTEYNTVVTPEKRTVVTWTCVPQEVISQVAVTRCVACTVVDSCGNCHVVSKPVCEMQTVKHTVMRSVPVNTEVTVNVAKVVATEKKGKKPVTRLVEKNREETVNVVSCQLVKEKVDVMVNKMSEVSEEVTVNVCQTVWVEEKGTQKVCRLVERSKEETVNVVSFNNVEKEGTHKFTVCTWAPEKTRVKQHRCIMVPVQTVIKCPVYGPACCN